MEREVVVGIITAASALGGVLLSQAFSLVQSYFDKKHQKNILFRTKYEELTVHLNNSIVWANDLLRTTTFEELHARGQPTSARSMYALTLLYFPKLKEHAEEYVEASVLFQNVMVEHFEPLGGSTAGAQAAKRNMAAFQSAGERLRAARESIDTEIEKCASAYVIA